MGPLDQASARQWDENERGGPATLMIHLVGRCNLTCAHCYMEGAPARREQLPLDAVLQAIDDCPVLGVGTLFLTGGEPLLYRGLANALSAAAVVPNMRVTLCTNGTLLDATHLAVLQHGRAQLNVSIDGEPEFHDAFRRKPGAFAMSERGIRRAVQAGLEVTVVSTISRANLASLEWLAQWAADAGVSTLRFQPLLDLGRGTEIGDQRLGTPEINDLVIRATDLRTRYRGQMACNIIGQSRRFLLAHPCAAYVCNGAGCHRRVAREIKKIVVRENGLVLPEATNLNPRFAIGRFGEARLPALVQKYLDEDYDRFDALCRTTYAEVMPDWAAPIVPWDQILAHRSHRWSEHEVGASAGCQGCGSERQAMVPSFLHTASAHAAEVAMPATGA